MIWTGDHVDAARRLQEMVAEPARTAVREHALIPDRLAISFRASLPERSRLLD
jgi:hypothetical protein